MSRIDENQTKIMPQHWQQQPVFEFLATQWILSNIDRTDK
jgi:hypothetical protein